MKDDFLEFHKKQMRDSAYRREYNLLEAETALIRSLIEARIRLGLTQSQIADKAGLKQEAVARFESGGSNPTFKTLKKVAEALDCNLVLVPKTKVL